MDRTGLGLEWQPGIQSETPGPASPQAVSVVIPAHNEAEHIEAVVAEIFDTMQTTGWDFELIVVDDGSVDATAERAALTGAKVISYPRNRGYGAALKKGIESAVFEWILITDADGTYPAESIPDILAEAEFNDMVVGARTGNDVHVPMVRRPAKWFLRKLAGFLAGQKLPDLNSGMRLIKKSLVERYAHLLPSGFSFTTTITLAAACNDHPVHYVSIDYRRRMGESKIRPRNAFDFLLLIVRTIVFFNPLKVFLPLGAVLALAGIAKFAYDVTQGDLSESATMAFLGALIVWSLGLLADQNSRIAMGK